MIAERIKKETKHAHQSLDSLLIPQIKKITTLHEYTKLLGIFYIYFREVESLIDSYLDDSIIPHYAKRRKAKIIPQDIRNMHIEQEAINLHPSLPVISCRAHALGAMYVLEGSTLGGKIISSILKDNLSAAGKPSYKFFDGYGENTGEMWLSFTTALNSFPATAYESDKIIQAASDTFKKFEEWIVENSGKIK